MNPWNGNVFGGSAFTFTGSIRAMHPHLLLILCCLSFAKGRAQGTFIEMSQQAGIDHYQKSELHLGGGVAVFDYNNDGWEDIYLTGGENRDKLYRNNGNLTFTDVGVSAGFGATAAVTTLGVVTGDIDNDGFRDVLVLTELGFENMLYRNNGDGTFSRLVTALGQSTIQRSTSATMGDVNGDGFLDIYVTNYVRETGIIFGEGTQVIGFNHQCDADRLFINNGDLTFTESSLSYGIVQEGCGLAAAITDFDSDGAPDIMVVNDFGQWIEPNALYRNRLPFIGFDDVSTAMDIGHGFYGMGVAIGDYDRDGDLDYYMTNIGRNYLYRNDGDLFTELAEPSGVMNDSVYGLNTTGWSTFFFDHDNDGLLDLYVANGEIPSAPFIANALQNPDRLFMNLGDGTFIDISELSGIGSEQRSRGAAYGDFNNDGLLDFVVNTVKHNEPGAVRALLHINTTENDNHFIRLSLRGVHSNRDCFGGRVRLVTGDVAQTAEVDGGSGHASHNSSIVHFGLGSATMADSIIVRFPSGHTTVLTGIAADQTITVLEDLITSSNAIRNPMNVIRISYRDFKVTGIREGAEFSAHDLSGRIVAQGRTDRSGAFALPDQVRGVAILTVISNGRMHREKLILE